jgi:hypothetical protein
MQYRRQMTGSHDLLSGTARFHSKSSTVQKMHRLPIAIATQIVGRSLKEEKVLASTERVKSALEESGNVRKLF